MPTLKPLAYNRMEGGVLAVVHRPSIGLPCPGVWWCTGGVVVAVRDPDAYSHDGPIIDSNLDFADVWPRVAKDFGLPESSEWFKKTYGRMRLVKEESEGEVKWIGVLRGEDKPNVFLQGKIAEAFGLTEPRFECVDVDD
jgi:hypothetical protein